MTKQKGFVDGVSLALLTLIILCLLVITFLNNKVDVTIQLMESVGCKQVQIDGRFRDDKYKAIYTCPNHDGLVT